MTPANFPGQDFNLSEVLTVRTNYGDWNTIGNPSRLAANPDAREQHLLLTHRELTPDYFLAPWPEPLQQPQYADRY